MNNIYKNCKIGNRKFHLLWVLYLRIEPGSCTLGLNLELHDPCTRERINKCTKSKTANLSKMIAIKLELKL